MSDPVTNDYGLVMTLSEREQRKALLTFASLNDGAKPMRGALGALDLIDMLGLTGMANEIRREKGLSGPLTASLAHGGVRDAIGRLRSVQPPADTLDETCPSGEHLWVEANIYTNETTGRKRCRVCRNRRKQTGPAQPKAPDAPLLCKCPDETHVLTKETSATTYVTKSGKRLCKVGEKRRKKISQAKRAAENKAAREATAAVSGLKPGERFCGCPDARHILTPVSSETTYVYPNGKRRCRAVRQRAQRERQDAAKRGRAA